MRLHDVIHPCRTTAFSPDLGRLYVPNPHVVNKPKLKDLSGLDPASIMSTNRERLLFDLKHSQKSFRNSVALGEPKTSSLNSS